jgi:PPM family protein phosphatase
LFGLLPELDRSSYIFVRLLKKMLDSAEQQGVMPSQPIVQCASLSDVGCIREQNEDSVSYWEPEQQEELDRKGVLAVVADGMGGYDGGQEASRLAVETVCESYRVSDADPQTALLVSLQLAHERIQEYASQHPELLGMGTTCTALCLVGGNLYFAHVGDSRLYLIRGSVISRLTRDHSYVSRLVENGLLQAHEAETHPQRHILIAALGVGAELVPDCPERPWGLLKDDALVLCSDGLWGTVADKEIQKAVSDRAPAEACRELVDLAKGRGGPDNITIQILRVTVDPQLRNDL